MHSVSEHEQDSVSVIISDDESNKRSDDNITKEGDASIETDDTPYETWLAAEGLMKLKESKENIHKKITIMINQLKERRRIQRKLMIVVIKVKWMIVVIKRKLMIVVMKRK